MAALRDILSRLEHGFWTEGANYYREHLAPSCLMVLPGVGLMRREAVIEGIEGGERWRTVEMSDVDLLELTSDEAILVYEARAERESQETPYRAHVASVYSHRAGEWKLAFHQQTPTE